MTILSGLHFRCLIGETFSLEYLIRAGTTAAIGRELILGMTLVGFTYSSHQMVALTGLCRPS